MREDEDGWLHDQRADDDDKEEVEEEVEEEEEEEEAGSGVRAEENETQKIFKKKKESWSPLVVSINMIEDFFYGCEDPDDLDPSLHHMVLHDPYYASEENGFGMLVYRGQCSFVQKARLAEWLGCSLLIVIDSDTEGYVHDPPEKTSAEVEQEDDRVQTFFRQLRGGSLPRELGTLFLIFFFLFSVHPPGRAYYR
jgi:hypothetical protein